MNFHGRYNLRVWDPVSEVCTFSDGWSRFVDNITSWTKKFSHGTDVAGTQSTPFSSRATFEKRCSFNFYHYNGSLLSGLDLSNLKCSSSSVSSFSLSESDSQSFTISFPHLLGGHGGAVHCTFITAISSCIICCFCTSSSLCHLFMNCCPYIDLLFYGQISAVCNEDLEQKLSAICSWKSFTVAALNLATYPGWG